MLAVMSAVWEEPVRGAVPPLQYWAQPGLAQVEGFISGLSPKPPLHHLTGMRPVSVSEGTCMFAMPATPWLAGPTGHILGGVLAVLADGPFGGAIQTALPPLTPYTTTELSLSFLRPAVPDGRELFAHGRLIHAGRSLALSDVRVEDADGHLLAHGTSRCFIFPSNPVPPGLPPLEKPEEPSYDTPDPWQRRPVPGQLVPAEAWRDRSGLDIARAWLSGEYGPPPIYHLTGQCIAAADEGTARFTLPTSPWLLSPAGNLEGGFLTMLADATMATAVQTTVPAGTAFAPVDVTVKFVRPAPPDTGLLTADGRVVHRGRSMAVAVGEIRNAEGKLVCTATSSALIRPGRTMTGADALVPDDEALD
jgi:uncharacterized protein (TIGR00369 family)